MTPDWMLTDKQVCFMICEDRKCLEPKQSCNEYHIVRMAAKAQAIRMVEYLADSAHMSVDLGITSITMEQLIKQLNNMLYQLEVK
jgi:hypothetical protein